MYFGCECVVLLLYFELIFSTFVRWYASSRNDKKKLREKKIHIDNGFLYRHNSKSNNLFVCFLFSHFFFYSTSSLHFHSCETEFGMCTHMCSLHFVVVVVLLYLFRGCLHLHSCKMENCDWVRERERERGYKTAYCI